jgi:hypothetical protein
MEAAGKQSTSFVGAVVFALLISIPPRLFAQSKAPSSTSQVPFVGCNSDGQIGPKKAPAGKSKVVAIAPGLAQQLAYYQAEIGQGVLAPRGWNCFGTYGSSGSSLYVTPEPINAGITFSEKWKGFAGPVVQLSDSIGDTSGRFEVAGIIARVFPAHKAFVTDVVAEGIEPASSFPSGPYPTDKLTYKSDEIVEYVTPADHEGLGTRSRLQASSIPISGVAILTGEEFSLTHLAVRLPPNLANLAPAILQQVEHEGTAPQ